MTDDKIAGYKVITTRYRNFRKHIRSIWESFNLVNFYADLVRSQVSKDKMPLLSFEPLLSGNLKTHDKANTVSLLLRLRSKENPRRALIESVSAFEDFLGQLVGFVYKDYPGKLLGSAEDVFPENQENILRAIINSADREEILTRITDERIRSLFYGSPLSFFVKDKAKLEFGDYFRSRPNTMSKYQEITSRRNIVIHNGGRVDRKYLQEVKSSELKLGQVVSITPDYLRDSIVLFEGLAAASATLVLVRIYKQGLEKHSDPLKGSYRAFERIFVD